MADKNAKQIAKKAADKESEIVINRIIMIFSVAVAFVIYLLNAPKITAAQYLELNESRINGIAVPLISALLLAGAIVFFILMRVKGVEEKHKSVNSYNMLFCTAGFALIAVPVWLNYRSEDVCRQLLIAVIAVTVLYLVYYLYQKEFFMFSVFTAAGAYALFLSTNIIMNILVFAAAVIVVVIALLLKIKRGVIKLGENKLRVLSYNANYLPYFILAAVLVASGIAVMISGVILYPIIAVFALYIIMGIVYTVKLI